MKFTVNVQLPVAEDALGQWLEEHGAEISIQCMLGTYDVTVGWSKLRSHTDAQGTHRETWRVSRHKRALPEALAEAIGEAMRQTKEP